MTQLTEERFEQILAERLKAQTTELKAYAREQTAELARMVAEGFDELKRELDVRERVVKLESDMTRIKEALQVSA